MARKRQRKHNITAIIYDKKGRVLSIGRNNYKKSHPLQAHFANLVGKPDSIYLHAEIDALRRLKHGKPYSISVMRFSSDGSPANAEPCPICQKALTCYGITEWIHT